MADKGATTSTRGDPGRRRRLIEVGLIVAAVLALDLGTKAWAWENLRDKPAITVIENWFYFEFGFNTGSAFSFLRDASYARATFIVVTIIALIYMARLAATLPTKFRSSFIAVGLVSGGALGNLHDRLFRIMELRDEARHGVVDFIKIFYWENKPWPTFNVADVALVVGVFLLFIFLTRHGDALDDKKKKKKKKRKKKAKKVAAKKDDTGDDESEPDSGPEPEPDQEPDEDEPESEPPAEKDEEEPRPEA